MKFVVTCLLSVFAFSTVNAQMARQGSAQTAPSARPQMNAKKQASVAQKTIAAKKTKSVGLTGAPILDSTTAPRKKLEVRLTNGSTGLAAATGATSQALVNSSTLAPVQVQSQALPRKTRIDKSGTFTSMISLGMDMRAERDQQQSTVPRMWPTLTIGFGMKPWMALLEYASFSERSGNNALNVQRKAETALLWGHWAVDEDWALQPYLGVGFGGYRTSAEMTLYSNRGGAQSRWVEHGAAALGLRFQRASPFLLSAEGRVHMNRELDPNPTLGAMLKIGFIIE